jgi:hypothetical protein
MNCYDLRTNSINRRRESRLDPMIRIGRGQTTPVSRIAAGVSTPLSPCRFAHRCSHAASSSTSSSTSSITSSITAFIAASRHRYHRHTSCTAESFAALKHQRAISTYCTHQDALQFGASASPPTSTPTSTLASTLTSHQTTRSKQIKLALH